MNENTTTRLKNKQTQRKMEDKNKQRKNNKRKQEEQQEENQQQQKITRYMINNEQQTENKQQNHKHNNETKQQQQNGKQHPKLTIRTRGIEITDMKKFLADKRKERAARVVGENYEIKVNSVRSHDKNFSKLLYSAHEDGTMWISERDEPDGSNSSAAKGIS